MYKLYFGYIYNFIQLFYARCPNSIMACDFNMKLS